MLSLHPVQSAIVLKCKVQYQVLGTILIPEWNFAIDVSHTKNLNANVIREIWNCNIRTEKI